VTDAKWKTEEVIALRNVTFRRLILSLGVEVTHEGAAPLRFDVRPNRISLPAGRTVRVRLRVRVTGTPDGDAPAEGTLVVTPAAGRGVRVPWAILFGKRSAPPLGSVRLSLHSFEPSDAAPALLSFVAGSVSREAGRIAVQPLARLNLDLWSPVGGRIGRLAGLRDVLPGRYSFGVTGRDPTGAELPSGRYQLRVIAYGTDPGPPTVKTVAFTIK
jgi:hypothetical protein